MILSALLVSFFYGIIRIPESLVKIVVDTVLFLISYQIQKRFVF
jgi:dolichol-phosphate mannosyltransferase